MYDALVIGGGPAGLQAALTLGRMHRTVVLADSGHYRNDAVEHAHNFLTHDGRAPAEIRRLAREDLVAYETVEVRETTVQRVREVEDGFVAETDEEAIEARILVLATGLRDDLQAIAGLEEAWGREVATCPFCHGHELAGRVIGLVGDGPHIPMMVAMLDPIGSEVVRFGDGEVTKIERTADGVLVHREAAAPVAVAGLFLHPGFTQSSPFAEQLGLEMLASGCIRIDVLGQTSHPRVFAGGDLAHVPELPMPMASVLLAAAAGQVAASSVVRFLAAQAVESAEGSDAR
ncbi:NAD(P)/FAD-dependent oxidoreductase [Aeromicrobium duanguangcaii]|uniref:NAD(P)/FAD-dependent oxidoreductase n=1 Tax=Aeromicrobium duanguangcaii TaxID=2968086 RepID=UPI002016F198|nr:NAD(P)/FAD-dependent oxidoreductase [Aeromicrobium duanguangcaii]MCL3836575.1 NAD(P)/FAD-dependent oxidoreductase [Aeromicrobium duanguangcaii]